MKLHLTHTAGQNLITAYDTGAIVVNGQRQTRSLILGAETLFPWAVSSLSAMPAEALRALLDLSPELVLLAEGDALQLPSSAIQAQLTAPFHAAGIGVEILSVPAACRVWNYLVAEGRKVAAGFVLG
jgi:uncharacterized protein